MTHNPGNLEVVIPYVLSTTVGLDADKFLLSGCGNRRHVRESQYKKAYRPIDTTSVTATLNILGERMPLI